LIMTLTFNSENNIILTQRSVQLATKDLLESNVIPLDKLKQYIRRHSIAVEYKVFVWKLLLGIVSPYRETRSFKDNINHEIYSKLLATLETCRILTPTTPLLHKYLYMYLLQKNNSTYLPVQTINEYEHFFEIGNFVCLFNDNDPVKNHRQHTNDRLDVECWMITCSMYEKFSKLLKRSAHLVCN
ncbi:unnamed protein product, partial [Didymodactylos carnosus]